MIELLVQRKLFRNANHAIWFLCSLGFLAVLLGMRYFPGSKLALILIPLIVHLPPFVTASIVTIQGRKSEIYSEDCIWFNGLMILIYSALYFLF